MFKLLQSHFPNNSSQKIHHSVWTSTSMQAQTLEHTECYNTNVFLREVTGASDALVVYMALQLLDHVGQPVGYGPQQGVHVGHVWTQTTNSLIPVQQL